MSGMEEERKAERQKGEKEMAGGGASPRRGIARRQPHIALNELLGPGYGWEFVTVSRPPEENDKKKTTRTQPGKTSKSW